MKARDRGDMGSPRRTLRRGGGGERVTGERHTVFFDHQDGVSVFRCKAQILDSPPQTAN